MAQYPFAQVLQALMQKAQQDRADREAPFNNVVGALNTVAQRQLARRQAEQQRSHDFNKIVIGGAAKGDVSVSDPNGKVLDLASLRDAYINRNPINGTMSPVQKTTTPGNGTVWVLNPETLQYENTGKPTGTNVNYYKDLRTSEDKAKSIDRIREEAHARAEGAGEVAPIVKARTDQAMRAAKLGEMYKAVDFFENKINEIPSGEGISGRLAGLGTLGEAWLQTNPKAAAYKANVEGLRSQIARGLGEVGNLAENEQKYAVSLLPQITDNMETRSAKLKNFRDYITTKLGDNVVTGSRAKYSIGQVISAGGKNYKVVGGDLNSDPDIEEVQ